MAAIVSPTLLNLAGLPGDASEPHIQRGHHLRVAHNPILGLPVAPFVIQRAPYEGQLPDGISPRRDVVFRDAANRLLTLPISVNKGDEIRATIVQGSAVTCIWVAMMSESLRQEDGNIRPVRTNVPPRLIAEPDRRLSKDTIVAVAARDAMLKSLAMTRARAASVDQPKSGDLHMRAYSASAGNGPALVGERSAAPHVIGAPGIAEIVITGRGIITDMLWIAAQDFKDIKWETVDVLNLPHPGGRRYISVSDARDQCERRMRNQAPKLRPLQETSGAIAPAAAPPFTDNDESDRVNALAFPLMDDLDQLITGSAPPLLASEVAPVTDENGNSLASVPGEESSIEVSYLGRVLQSTLDPGVAAWLGFKSLVEPDQANKGFCIYRVVGFFRNPLAIGAKLFDVFGLPLGQIPTADRQLSAPEVRRTVDSLAGGYLANKGATFDGTLETANDYMMMAAVAVLADVAVPDSPRAPTLLATEHVGWLPAVPPTAVREVLCPVRDILVGATLAVEREQALPGNFTQLNQPLTGTPWHTPLTLGLVTDANGTPLINADQRQGVLTDRRVAAEDARFHVAQQDRFGRWSSFADVYTAPGPRPKPPRPVVQGNYVTPAIADAATSGGTLQLRVPLPELDSLAPGAFPLSHVRLFFRHHGVAPAPFVEVPLTDVDVAVGAAIAIDVPPPGEAARRALPATVAGPVLQPTEQRRIVITAVWIDTAGQQSVMSEPLKLLMTDPRPPAQMPIADVLLYSSRPDAMGLAWIERSWPLPPGPPPIYAAYYTDEVRLLAWLRSQGRTAEATSIANTSNRASRAGMLRAIQSQFPDHLFERLNGAIDTSLVGQRRLRHAVSGSSRVLNAYKIAVEASASGARPNLAGLDTVFYGVPNSDPPPRPAIEVRQVEPNAGEAPLVAEVIVTVEPGVTTARDARIYRTRGSAADPLQVPLVTTLALSPPDPVTGRQSAVFRDTGTAQIAPTARLTPFAQYRWFADVQGAPESGSSVPGLWSQPSDPVSIPIIPIDGPEAPVFEGFTGTAVAGGKQDLALSISHPLPLSPTVLGGWTIEILRAEPGNDWSVMTAGPIAVVPLVISDAVAGPGGITPQATQFRITLFDPLGRPSPAIDVVTS